MGDSFIEKKKCCYCESTEKKMTREHIIPLSKGGAHHRSNIRYSCWKCNHYRGNKELDVWQLEIRRMLINMDFKVWSFAELTNIFKNIDIIKMEVKNSTPEMWYSGKVGVITKPRYIERYDKK